MKVMYCLVFMLLLASCEKEFDRTPTPDYFNWLESTQNRIYTNFQFITTYSGWFILNDSDLIFNLHIPDKYYYDSAMFRGIYLDPIAINTKKFGFYDTYAKEFDANWYFLRLKYIVDVPKRDGSLLTRTFYYDTYSIP